jgi:hypothetical protein
MESGKRHSGVTTAQHAAHCDSRSVHNDVYTLHVARVLVTRLPQPEAFECLHALMGRGEPGRSGDHNCRYSSW